MPMLVHRTICAGDSVSIGTAGPGTSVGVLPPALVKVRHTDGLTCHTTTYTVT